ncbi:MAG TPA: Rieske 2Fe-2S domain-containing protein [Cellvibrio sp.]|nr:Rieske 2Fe-2S domain-containing protein [Cellvibrio sp.]
MNLSQHYAWPVALAADISGTKPYALVVNNKPLVAFRGQDQQVHILDDSCPHRFAPLSQGKVIAGEIQCPYHGWQFDHQGICTRVPGLSMDSSKTPLVQSYLTQEHGGLIWLVENKNPGKIVCTEPQPQSEELDIFFMQNQVECEQIDLIENFLDGFHTHFIHSGLVRKDKNRQQLTAKIRPLADGIEVEYSGESKQNGIISRWLEGSRGLSLARFRLPNMAELEYRDQKNRLTLMASLWATPQLDNQHKVFVRIATRRGFWPAAIKRFFLQKLFNRILLQDKTILEAVYRHKFLTKRESKPLDSKNDLLAPYLRQLLATGKPLDFIQTIQVVNL